MKPAIVIPIFDNQRTIAGVVAEVRGVLAARDGKTVGADEIPIIIVNDGSIEATRAALGTLENVTLLLHAKNRGKGAALITGMTHAAAMGCTHAITIDADGQHDPPDVLAILDTARAHPEDLIIGHRNMDAMGPSGEKIPVPLRSKKGRDAARFWLGIQTGQHIPDTQCGLRAYPITAALAVPHRFPRYDFETEILARLAWSGLKIKSVPVTCIYFPRCESVSHFRPVRDTLRGVRVNVFLVARRLAPIPFKRLVQKPADPTRVEFGRWWKWETWKSAVRDSIRAGGSNSELAMAFALGIFVGLTPFYMLQTVLAIYFARRLHLNVIAAVIGSQISIPPLMPLWAMLSYAVGHLLLTGHWVLSDMHEFSNQWSWNFSAMSSKLAPFLIGTVPVALGVSLLGLLVARALLFCLREKQIAK